MNISPEGVMGIFSNIGKIMNIILGKCKIFKKLQGMLMKFKKEVFLYF